ncbi:MAG: hypothetical protein M3T55_01830 [Pseudomonadota bacterium]|nr:hypothetical protein [Pseudomonadota bacterium]
MSTASAAVALHTLAEQVMCLVGAAEMVTAARDIVAPSPTIRGATSANVRENLHVG